MSIVMYPQVELPPLFPKIPFILLLRIACWIFLWFLSIWIEFELQFDFLGLIVVELWWFIFSQKVLFEKLYLLVLLMLWLEE